MNQKTTTTARTRDAATAAKSKAADKPETVEDKSQTGTAVATTSKSSAPSYLQDKVKTDAGKGVSTAAEDNMVPLVYVLQTNSPQVNPRDPAYVQGALPGDIWLRGAPHPIVKGEVGMLAQPCYFYKEVVEWIPKDKNGGGGGYVGRHDTMPADAKEVADPDDPTRKRMLSPRGTEYVDTRCQVVLIDTVDGRIGYVIPFSSTGHTPARAWMFSQGSKTVDGQKAPSWACKYRLKTIQKTKGGHSWFMFDISDGGEELGPAWVTLEEYEAGAKVHDAFASGAKKAEAPVEATAGPAAGASDADADAKI